MKKNILKYLKEYSFDTIKIDKLIVSSFLYSNGHSIINNKFISKYFISKDCDEYKSVEAFMQINKKISFENLIELFEYVISPSDKVVSGAVFTPSYIREYIVDACVQNKELNADLRICDPACGCSGFLYTVVKKIKEETNLTYKNILENVVYGLDIQPYSVTRSKILLNLLSISEGEDVEVINLNIFEGNALNFDWSSKGIEDFDIVLGNPPYVCSRNIDEISRKLLDNWQVCSTGHPDLYIPFFELGIKNLKANGVLGYITMNTFFKSLNARALREYFKKSSLDFRIIDFAGNQVFNSKATYTCICLIRKNTKPYIKYKKLNQITDLFNENIEFEEIDYELLDVKNGWNLKEYRILNKIENTGIRLGDKFKSRNGIATLKNKLYIFDPVNEDDKYYYLQNGSKYPIEKAICKDIINPNKLVKASSLDELRKKIIFPYSHNNDNVKLLKEKEFKKNYPYAYKYLLSKKEELGTRDKGNGEYENWYAYGRNQSLEKLKYKLFFPHITPSIPNYLINSDDNLLFHNGLAIIGESMEELMFLKKLMSSRIFWFYITNSSRHYGTDYFSLSKNYFKNFGIYDFTDEDVNYLLEEENDSKVNNFIESKYNIQLS